MVVVGESASGRGSGSDGAGNDRVVVFGVRQAAALSGPPATLSFVHCWTVREGTPVRMEGVFGTVRLQQAVES